jgi:hypothetical protein
MVFSLTKQLECELLCYNLADSSRTRAGPQCYLRVIPRIVRTVATTQDALYIRNFMIRESINRTVKGPSLNGKSGE